MTVRVFFDPDLVGQLAACGITQLRRPAPGAAATGFVLEGRRAPPRPRAAITNVVAVRGSVTITGPRQPIAARTTARELPAASAAPQTALELAETCDQLRRDNRRLTDEVARLRAEVDRLSGSSNARPQALDDAATRFSLLELDL